jgi:hypothetical protein
MKMQDKTAQIVTELADEDELKKLELENIRKMLGKPIEASDADDFYKQVGLKGYMREKYLPETLRSEIPEVKAKPIKYQSLSELAPDLRGSDIDPEGTRTLHKSKNMASQEALDWVKKQNLSKADLPSIPKFLDETVDVPFSKLKSAIKPAGKLAGAVGRVGTGAAMGGPMGAVAGLVSSIGEEVLFPDELGPESGSDDEIIENPTLPLNVRKAAMMRAKNKYLKPQED